jgi:hypothetical protein
MGEPVSRPAPCSVSVDWPGHTLRPDLSPEGNPNRRVELEWAACDKYLPLITELSEQGRRMYSC